MSPEKGELLGGAVKREDRVLKDSPVVAIEPRSSQEVVIPKNWALLTHGTNLGKTLSDIHKQNLSKSLMGRESWSKGRKFSKQYRIKLSISHRGQKSPMEGKHHSDETKLKLRKSRCKWIKQHYGGPQYNPKACKYLDKLNKEKGWDLQHALNGGEYSFLGYFVDGYDKDKNIIVEYDEPKHYTINDTLKEKDLKRQNNIIKFQSPSQFWRYNEKIDKLERIL